MKEGDRIKIKDDVKTYGGQKGTVSSIYNKNVAYVVLDGWQNKGVSLPFHAEDELTVIEEVDSHG